MFKRRLLKPTALGGYLLYDLHTHSDASDGILSPETLVSRAKAQGVTHLALTDHDSIAGVTLAQQEAERLGLELISGVEFSTQWQGHGVHIVGLNFDATSPAIVAALQKQQAARHERGKEIGRRLAKEGIDGAWEGALRFAQGAVVGRPHFAQYLIEQGHVKTVNMAFKRYLGAGKAGDVKQCWLDMDEVIAAINNAGGVAVLAHPLKYKLTLTKLRRLAVEFCELGGRAIEVSSGPQTPNQTQSMAQLCDRFNLLASCGSDFHSPQQGWQELGKYACLPESCAPVWEHW